jgi:putative peptidoglycan lipid II flippase
VAFLLIPDLIMRALFMRGAFTAADAAAAGQTLAAYAIGLLPFVLVRSVVAIFLARGDTATPVRAALIAAVVNVGFKAVFFTTTSLAQVGLALATTIGAWLNLGLVLWFAARAGRFEFGGSLARSVGRLAAAGVALALVLSLVEAPVVSLFSAWPRLRDEASLATLAGIGAVVYGAAVIALFGPQWLAAFRRRMK